LPTGFLRRLYQAWRQRLRTRIADRIALAASLLTLSVALLVGVLSLAYTLQLTRASANDRLHEATRDAAIQLSQMIDGALGDIRLLARNPTIIAAVVGGDVDAGRLAPLLASFHPIGREPARLCAASRSGTMLSCDRDSGTQTDLPALALSLADSAPKAALVDRQGRPFLQLAAPVVDGGGELRGIVVGEYGIDRLVASALGAPSEYFHLHLSSGDRDLFVHGPLAEAIVQDRALDLAPALEPLALRLHLGMDEAELWAPIRNVLAVYLGALALLLPLVYLAARQAADLLSARLANLTRNTRALAGDIGDAPATDYGDDEVGELARAFAEVVERLDESRAGLERKVAERTRELQSSLDEIQALSTAIGQSAVSVIITDRKGKIRFVNPDFEHTTGYSRQEVVGQSSRILKSGRTLPYEYGALWATITAGQVWRGEFENVRKDGSHYFAQASIAPIRDSDGEITGFVAIEEDITERKRVEREIRARENYLHTLVDSLPDTLLVLNHDGIVAQLRAPDAHLGSTPGVWTSDWCVGRHYLEVLPREIAAPITAILPEIRHGGGHRKFEYTIRRGSEKRHYSASIRRIDAEQPDPSGYVVLSRDISEAFRLQVQLIRSEARFRMLLQDIESVAVQGYDRDRHVVFWNRASEVLYGWTRDEAVGRRLEDLIVPASMREQVVADVEAWITHGRPIPAGELTLQRKDGAPVYVYSCHAMQTNAAGEPELFCIDMDLSERRRAEARMREALVVFNASSQGIMTTDRDGIITAINPAFSAITGYRPEEVIGNRSSMFKSGRHDGGFYDAMWASLNETGRWEGEIWNRRRSGEMYPQWLNIAAVRDEAGEISEYVAMFSDISLRKQQEEMIWRQANFDALTGLANRNLLNDRLERAIAQARRNGRIAGVLFLDLDGFKAINDRHGHAVGDELLVDAARRLSACVREQDTVARMGGDEFTLVVQDAASREDLVAIAHKVVVALRGPFLLSSGTANISGSVGIACFPDDGEDAATLLRHADAAMYAAKGSGKDRVASYQASAESGTHTDEA
jgi:diguanylate cyclase (GGDEF)-like protein/PAS domain S-box-containing protein